MRKGLYARIGLADVDQLKDGFWHASSLLFRKWIAAPMTSPA